MTELPDEDTIVEPATYTSAPPEHDEGQDDEL
jgi:hypothetical protein